MIYFVYGNDSSRIKGVIKKIANSRLESIDELNFVRFDAENTLVQDVVFECASLPLGYERKVVSLENCYFLAKQKVKNSLASEQDLDSLLKYLQSSNGTTDLILSTNSDKLDEKSKIYAILKEKAKISELVDPEPKKWIEFVKEYTRDKLNMNIDNDAVKELADRTQCDMLLLKNSANKLSLYKDHITYEDVCFMVNRPLEDKVFQIYNYLLSGKNTYAISLFRDLKTNNVEPIALISILAGQFRLLNQVVYLAKNGFSDDEASKKLGIKPTRYAILKRSVYVLSENKIQSILNDLFQLDYEIKSGYVDRFYAFELFLINFSVR